MKKKENVVFIICGLYKTGTSLLAHKLETKYKLFNPAKITNSQERGYGTKGNRYFTLECAELREINLKIKELKEQRKHFTKSAISDYLYKWPVPLILKDPLFSFTLQDWITVIVKNNFDFYIFFTHRNENDVIKSWKFAPYTSKIYNQKLFDNYKNEFEIQKQFIIKNYSDKYSTITFRDYEQIEMAESIKELMRGSL